MDPQMEFLNQKHFNAFIWFWEPSTVMRVIDVCHAIAVTVAISNAIETDILGNVCLW